MSTLVKKVFILQLPIDFGGGSGVVGEEGGTVKDGVYSVM